MPTRCIAVGCKNTASPSGKTATQMKFEKVMKITFHSFPSDPIRRAEWIRIMKLEDKIITSRSRLCSLHFKEKYIDRTSLVCVRLRENAIPHIFEDSLHCDDIDTAMKNERTILSAQSVKTTILTEPLKPMKQEDNLKQNSVIHTAMKNERTILSAQSVKTTILTEPLKPMKQEDNLKQNSVIYSVCDKETNTAPFLLQEIRTSTENKETRISPERIWNMNLPDIEAIRQERCTEIKSLRKQIQTLQKKVWQKHKKIAIMKTILNELKIVKYN